MFAAEHLQDWTGQDVIDTEGGKIGSLESVYFDTTTDEPSFLAVKVGMIGKHRLAFVPAAGATVSPKAVRVRHAKKLVQGCPSIDTDGQLTVDLEPQIFAHYNLTYGSGVERKLARR